MLRQFSSAIALGGLLAVSLSGSSFVATQAWAQTRTKDAAKAESGKLKPASPVPQDKTLVPRRPPAKAAPNPRLKASAGRHVSLQLADFGQSESVYAAEEVFPLSVSIKDEVGSSGDLSRLEKPADRRVQICVLVAKLGAPKTDRDRFVLKFKGDTIVAPAGRDRSASMKIDFPLPPGEYSFYVGAFDPDSQSIPTNWEILGLPANDSFFPGRPLASKGGVLRVTARKK